MSYKTILVHVDASPKAEQRFRCAADLARSFGAHLVGCAPTGISRFIPHEMVVGEGAALADLCMAMRANAADSLMRFTQVISEHGVPPAEERIIDDDASGIVLHARYADLVLVSQPDESMPTHGSAGELPGYLLRESGRPLLMVPGFAGDTGLQGTALVAWDGSVEATRAVTAALPLLRAASDARIMHIDQGQAGADPEAASCSRLVQYLQRHGISADVAYRSERDDIGEALLTAASDENAGLLVMGGYGRSPLRESLLGGVTASVLRALTLPVLLAH